MAMLRTFERMRPVEYAAATVVRMGREALRAALLGQSMLKVTETQFHRIYTSSRKGCAVTLGIPLPERVRREQPGDERLHVRHRG